MPSELDAKREAAIAAKEKERKERNAAIKADKQSKAEERASAKSAKEKADEAKEQQRKELEAKRNQNIKEKEEARKVREKEAASKPKEVKSKYSKKDVSDLYKVFREYDRDGNGTVDLTEFGEALKKKSAGPGAGVKSTLAQRKAAEGPSIYDQAENIFGVMDNDNSGTVTFREMLMITYPNADAKDLDVMEAMVAEEAPPEPEAAPDISDDAKEQIQQIFKLYDKNKDGSLNANELVNALKNTGLDKDEITALFKEYDTDGDKKITKSEFIELMKSTGAFD